MSRIRIVAVTVTAALALVLVAGPAAADHGTGVATSHPAPKNTRMRIEVVPDAKKGYNLFVTTKSFKWAPEHVNLKHRSGEGHAHLYVDGEKMTRLYGPSFYLDGLAPGTHTIGVTLNGNDHGDYMHGNKVVEAEVQVDVPTTPTTMVPMATVG